MKAGKRNRRETCCDVKRDGAIWKREAKSIEAQRVCGSVHSSDEASVMEVEQRD
jgi:hypothetical protein